MEGGEASTVDIARKSGKAPAEHASTGIEPRSVLGLKLRTMFALTVHGSQGGLDAQALRSQVSLGRQALDGNPAVDRDSLDHHVQVQPQNTSSDRFSGIEFLIALLGFAALASELEGRR